MNKLPPYLLALLLTVTSGCATRSVRSATDVTPGNPCGERLDWRYGAGDIRIQTTKITKQLMDRWSFASQDTARYGKPRLIISDIDNRTDCYISTDMVRDIFEGVATTDGRFVVVVGDVSDEEELNFLSDKIELDSRYRHRRDKAVSGRATAPEFLAKVRITKATTASNRFDYEDYRMTVTLYDIETQEVVDSAWDVLKKRVQA